MELPPEILDRIFSLLVSYPKTLIACSEIPVLSLIIERHLFSRVVIRIDSNSPPDEFSALVSMHPHILSYVRILKIEAKFNHIAAKNQIVAQLLDEFATTLLRFPALESIILSAGAGWHWSTVFRAALEDRLNLPTVKELHLQGSADFPLSLLDGCKNIKNLSLSGFFGTVGRFRASTLPQLKSLTLGAIIFPSLITWIKLHITELRSLKYVESGPFGGALPEVLEACSGTLNTLDVKLDREARLTPRNYPNLQQLTTRTEIWLEFDNDSDDDDDGDANCVDEYYSNSRLPEAVEIINFFISSPKHLILDIDAHLHGTSDLWRIDFSPLAVLGNASLSIPRIDLYVHTGTLPATLTLSQLMSSLEHCKDVVRLIKEGVLVIHPEETAPDFQP